MMRKFIEAAELNLSAKRDDDTFTYGRQEFNRKGGADLPQRVSNARYGDNPMDKKETITEFDQTSMLDRLQEMLNKAGVSDDEISTGIHLTDRGLQKVAASLGISAKEVPVLLNSLATRTGNDDADQSDGQNALAMMEHFSFEKDYLGNVTVRDDQSGKEVFIQGDRATSLLANLKKNPEKEQEILAGFQNLMESDDLGFQEEIDAEAGTYNIPWKVKALQGTATILFKLSDGKPKLMIQSVRDNKGDEVEVGEDDCVEILKQAKDFIGNE